MRRLVPLALMFTACLPLSSPAPSVKINPIVRLVTKEGGTYCSGVVVTPTKILTAYHCTMSNRSVEIRGPDNKSVGASAEVYYAYPQTDSAILTGDFSLFKTAPYYPHIKDIAKHRNERLSACGYPMGGTLFCSKFSFTRMYGFFWGGDATLIPGMSGGPVFDESGAVVAINYGVDGPDALVSPTYTIYMIGDEK